MHAHNVVAWYVHAASLLEPLKGPCEADAGLKMTLLVRPKAEDGSAQMQQLLEAIKSAESQPLVGHLPKDKHEGKVVELFSQLLTDSGIASVDVAAGVAELLSKKDAGEVLNVKKAAMLGSKVSRQHSTARRAQGLDAAATWCSAR